jgi:hypothetical protein
VHVLCPDLSRSSSGPADWMPPGRHTAALSQECLRRSGDVSDQIVAPLRALTGGRRTTAIGGPHLRKLSSRRRLTFSQEVHLRLSGSPDFMQAA